MLVPRSTKSNEAQKRKQQEVDGKEKRDCWLSTSPGCRPVCPAAFAAAPTGSLWGSAVWAWAAPPLLWFRPDPPAVSSHCGWRAPTGRRLSARSQTACSGNTRQTLATCRRLFPSRPLFLPAGKSKWNPSFPSLNREMCQKLCGNEKPWCFLYCTCKSSFSLCHYISQTEGKSFIFIFIFLHILI